MQNREFDTRTETKPRLSRQVVKRQRDEHEARDDSLPQSNSFVPVISGIGDASSAGVHASMLNRATKGRPFRAARSLLRLQRQYGNRYVQRVLALAGKGRGDAEVAPELEQSIQQARGSGQALDSKVRTQMESAFGADFGDVRVHTDTQADTLNRELNARAFTTGQDIFFRNGAHRPGTSRGRELLAHELTHVVQQNGDKVQRKLTVGQPGDKYEQEADQVARVVMQHEKQYMLIKAGVGQVSKQVEEEKEEKSVRTQRQAEEKEKEEKPIQAKAEDLSAQRQIEEKEPVQTKPSLPDGEITFANGLIRYKDPALQVMLQKNESKPLKANESKPPGSLSNPIEYIETMKTRTWNWKMGDEALFSTVWVANFQVAAKFGKIKWGKGFAWVLDEVNASKQTETGLSGEIHKLTSTYRNINGQLHCSLYIQLRFKTSDVKETTTESRGRTLSQSDKGTIGASAPVKGVPVNVGVESTRGTSLIMNKSWGSETVIVGSTFDATRNFSFRNTGDICYFVLTNGKDPKSDMIGEIPGLDLHHWTYYKDWVKPNWVFYCDEFKRSFYDFDRTL